MDDEFDDGIACKYCHEAGLEWVEARIQPGNQKKWQLVDEDGNIHECRSVAQDHEFEDLTKLDSAPPKPRRRIRAT